MARLNERRSEHFCRLTGVCPTVALHVLWDLPDGMRSWLGQRDTRRCLLAEDARAMYGQFSTFCGNAPRNAARLRSIVGE